MAFCGLPVQSPWCRSGLAWPLTWAFCGGRSRTRTGDLHRVNVPTSALTWGFSLRLVPFRWGFGVVPGQIVARLWSGLQLTTPGAIARPLVLGPCGCARSTRRFAVASMTFVGADGAAQRRSGRPGWTADFGTVALAISALPVGAGHAGTMSSTADRGTSNAMM